MRLRIQTGTEQSAVQWSGVVAEAVASAPAPAVIESPNGCGSRFLWFYTAIAGSLLLRASLFDFESDDVRAFYGPWYDFFINHGRWSAFKAMEPHSVYPPLYMYLLSLSTLLPLAKLHAIKTISLVSDYVTAWFVWRLVGRGLSERFRPWAALTVFLFLPTVVLNGALWGQCDVMYTGCFLASLFYLLESRPLACLIAFGFACSLKPQAIFWCPFLAGLFFQRRLPWKWVWIPAAVYVACGLPIVMAGWSLSGMLGQMASYGGNNLPDLTLGATNWYQWVFEQHRDVFWFSGVLLTLVGTAFMALWMRERPAKHLTEPQGLISFALLSVLFPPFFLPGMHERYFFAADVLSVIYAFYLPRGFYVTALIQFSSSFTYLPYLFNREPVPRALLPLPILAAMLLVVRGLIQPERNTEQMKGVV